MTLDIVALVLFQVIDIVALVLFQVIDIVALVLFQVIDMNKWGAVLVLGLSLIAGSVAVLSVQSNAGQFPRGQIIGWWWKTKRVLNDAPSALPPSSGVGSVSLIEDLRQHMLKMKAEAMSADGGKVDYAALKRSPLFKKYFELVSQLKFFRLESLDAAQKKAALLNLYNSLIIDAVINNLLDTNGGTLARLKLYASASYNVGGILFSLNDIENGLLRCNRKSAVPLTSLPFRKEDDPRRKLMLPECDARVHFALNCAANGCPPIGIYSAAEIDEQLDIATQGFLDGSVKIDQQNNSITLSMLFSWYREDFGANDREVLDWIISHSAPDLRTKLLAAFPASSATPKLVYDAYDWGLNSLM